MTENETNMTEYGLLHRAEDFYCQNAERSYRMFGYPTQYVALSERTKRLILWHYTSPLSNNCGDIDERGNYAMDNKAAEREIVGLFAEKFGMGKNFWGYVTSGGSESNSAGIALAFREHPNGILYYSAASHYSVGKYAARYPHEEIPALEHDEIDTAVLFDRILKNYRKTGAPANLVLTFGTTKYGAVDDIDKIVAFLRTHGIPYFIHVDAALFGGIPNNQIGAPTLRDAVARGIDSISVSLHKYVGFPDVKSVIVAKKKPRGEHVAYIGQSDTTVSGSRSLPAYALLSHLHEVLTMRPADEYEKNILFFEGLLEDRKIPYYRAKEANIFVIDAPSDEVCKEFQLSTFDTFFENNTLQKSHIIIFPSHKKEDMIALADAIL